MRADTGELAGIDHQVLVADGAALEPALQDLTRTSRVVSRQRGSSAASVQLIATELYYGARKSARAEANINRIDEFAAVPVGRLFS